MPVNLHYYTWNDLTVRLKTEKMQTRSTYEKSFLNIVADPLLWPKKKNVQVQCCYSNFSLANIWLFQPLSRNYDLIFYTPQSINKPNLLTVCFIPYAVAEIVGMSDSGVKFCCTVRLTISNSLTCIQVCYIKFKQPKWLLWPLWDYVHLSVRNDLLK